MSTTTRPITSSLSGGCGAFILSNNYYSIIPMTNSEQRPWEHNQVYYLEYENMRTRFFKNYLRENAILRRYPSFFWQYRLLRVLHHLIPPFNYIKTGDTCVQVGCAEW